MRKHFVFEIEEKDGIKSLAKRLQRKYNPAKKWHRRHVLHLFGKQLQMKEQGTDIWYLYLVN